ncbi:phenylacetate--CoA ligase family protein [Bradyrhizobium erythrophlei]|uniref:phenylacetate--CoA ligase family protein n=1 Tax=Bradyrhizobium erythrophlei TaxID=1437360 RepID=UPI0035F0E358
MTAPLSVNSAIAGIAWPGIPAPTGAGLLAILFQLEQSQWWAPEEVSRRQRDQLKVLLSHAGTHVPFYRERLRDLGDLPADDTWPTVWRRIAPLIRAEIQAADAEETMITQALPPGHGELRQIYTSGSTGKPIRSVRTQLWELMWSAFTVRDHLWHRRDFRGTFATLRESGAGKALYPDGARSGSWGYSSATILKTGPMASLNITTPVEHQVEWLRRQDPDYLLTHPTIAQRLAVHCREHGVELPRLKQVITISENLKPEVRSAVRHAWGVPLVDIYSTREIGYIALQCPDHEHYHIQSEHVFVEVVNEEGQPCAPGEVGKLLVTSLHNLAMPLIRYDIGDFVEVGPPCPCGRGLPVINRILGRTQNMLIMPSGQRRWPLLSSANIESMLEIAPGIRQYQLVQKAPDLIELRLAVTRALGADAEARLAEWVRTKLGAPFRVVFAYFDEIPRTAAGKFEDFVCEIDR